MSNIITTVDYNNTTVQIYESDIRLIQCIRQLEYGELTKIKVQGGEAVIVQKCEKQIKLN